MKTRVIAFRAIAFSLVLMLVFGTAVVSVNGSVVDVSENIDLVPRTELVVDGDDGEDVDFDPQVNTDSDVTESASVDTPTPTDNDGTDSPPVPQNNPPQFPSVETGLRSVPENSPKDQAVGKPASAMDADDDPLTYTLHGADANMFDIYRSTGQITVGKDAVLDYEAKDSYTVVVTATDPSGASDDLTVTIQVTDMDTGSAIGNRYDSNKNEIIDKPEAIDAVIDYFNGLITKDEAIDVILLYFSGTK